MFFYVLTSNDDVERVTGLLRTPRSFLFLTIEYSYTMLTQSRRLRERIIGIDRSVLFRPPTCFIGRFAFWR
ncbi:hypothetical protein BH23BAC4_BH23BAC4_02420 [soil metagenome]